MPRLVSTLLVLGLLVGTAAAFAVTERLKLVPSPIVAPKVTPAFSTACGCETAAARIAFALREPDRVTVEMIDADDDVVGKPVDDEPRPAGAFEFAWRPADGALPDGAYRARVHLADARRTIVIPNETRLDTHPPSLSVQSIAPIEFSPDGDGRGDAVHVRFVLSERSSLVLLANGEEAVVTPPRERGKFDWYGSRKRPGRYALVLRARDLAGNESRPTHAVDVRLRFVAVRPSRIVVPARGRFGVRVSTDGRRYSWRLGARRGTSSRELLILRAPVRAGRYTLTVSYRGHAAATAVFVRPRP